MDDYATFLSSKHIENPRTGLDEVPDLNEALFDWQADIVRWALRRGRAAIFADCGLGKTLMQLEWARHVPGRVLLLAPLAVAQQTVSEGAKFGIDVSYQRRPNAGPKIVATNYELLDHFDPDEYDGVVLDESSILKSYTGKIRNRIIEAFGQSRFRLACTATPAPNDHMELGNHSEFLGVMSRVEMLATFFCHDGGSTQNWRIKGHAASDFWRWVSSWAVNMRMPSDLGYHDNGFILPDLRYVQHDVAHPEGTEGMLWAEAARSLQERIRARAATVDERVAVAADLVNQSDEPWVIWCNLNRESSALAAAIPGAVEVRGSDSVDVKESRIMAFSRGETRVLVTKPSICGFGMNWQHCARVAFVGLSDSWEQYYQAVRRCWRFGQKNDVEVHVVVSELEGNVVENIKRKERDADTMSREMVTHMKEFTSDEITGTARTMDTYATDECVGDGWTMKLGDCVDAVRAMPDESVHYSIFSPPFASLYTYSASDRDMGNVRNHDEFAAHFAFLVSELFRVLKPGRLVSFHCMNLPTSKARDGVIGIRDFRGELVRMFEGAGFIFHSEVCIWKDPVTAMQRTKALGLLHKQLKKDSCMSRQGIPDYLVTMRKDGENPEPVSHTNETFPVQAWQRYASPVWDDINPSDTLQYRSARENEDERHICPLQLGVIRRAMNLWTNEGDLVLSPFAGIGSEGYVAVEMSRKFIGVELKRSYWRQACKNIKAATVRAPTLFPC